MLINDTFIAARLLHAQRWKNSEISRMEEWIVEMTELAQMAKPIWSGIKEYDSQSDVVIEVLG